MEYWDVIIVGAGPAGSSAAYDLAKQGYRTLLLEKKGFPRHKPCGGALTIKAVAKLRFSISHLIRDQATYLALGYKTGKQKLLAAGGPICVFTVRQEFDQYCLDKALEQGADLRRCNNISLIESTADGVKLTTSDGEHYKGTYLIGADGAHSQVRKLTSHFQPKCTAVALEGILSQKKIDPAYIDNSRHMAIDFGAQKLGYGWVFPKGDHFNVGLFTYAPNDSKLSKKALAGYAKARLGSDAFTVIHGFPIATGGEYYRADNNRIFLVGDAAGMAEPLLGEGIHNAIVTGQAAAQSIMESRVVRNSRGEKLNSTQQAEIAHQAFNKRIKKVRRDVLLSKRLGPWFYRALPITYQVLVRYPVSRVLINGFAAGMTLTECRNAFGKFKTDFSVPEIKGLKELEHLYRAEIN